MLSFQSFYEVIDSYISSINIVEDRDIIALGASQVTQPSHGTTGLGTQQAQSPVIFPLQYIIQITFFFLIRLLSPSSLDMSGIEVSHMFEYS